MDKKKRIIGWPVRILIILLFPLFGFVIVISIYDKRTNNRPLERTEDIKTTIEEPVCSFPDVDSEAKKLAEYLYWIEMEFTSLVETYGYWQKGSYKQQQPFFKSLPGRTAAVRLKYKEFESCFQSIWTSDFETHHRRGLLLTGFALDDLAQLSNAYYLMMDDPSELRQQEIDHFILQLKKGLKNARKLISQRPE